jgi:hypothetical protein
MQEKPRERDFCLPPLEWILELKAGNQSPVTAFFWLASGSSSEQ